MEQKKYGKLPPPKDDVVAWNAKRRELYIEGIKYLYGQGGKDENVETAYQLIKQSADMNYSYAISAIGSFYLTGQVVAQDYDKAQKIFLEMYARLNPNAAYNLGVIYVKGLGVKVDLEKAEKYYYTARAFAAREVCRGEELLGLRVLIDALGLPNNIIFHAIKTYSDNPICEFCHGVVSYENDKAYFRNDAISFELRSKLFNAIDNRKYSRGEPVLKNGYCCCVCEHLFVDPIREALEAQAISKEEVDLLHMRDDMINAIKIFKNSD